MMELNTNRKYLRLSTVLSQNGLPDSVKSMRLRNDFYKIKGQQEFKRRCYEPFFGIRMGRIEISMEKFFACTG